MKRLFNGLKSTSLTQAVFKSYLLLGGLAFVITVAVSLFILYSIEDLTLERSLTQAEENYDKELTLPAAIQFYDINSSPEVLTEYKTKPVGSTIEYFVDGDNFYAKKVELAEKQGWLVLNASEQLIVSAAMKDVLVLFLVLSILLAILYWLFAKRLSQRIVQPFQLLLKQVEQPATSLQAIDDIEYHDVKKIAQQLLNNIHEKQRILEQNLLFNKGISHELRTPLQVIQNAVESITDNDVNLVNASSLQRLQNASEQLEQIVLAFLWLSRKEDHQDCTEITACIERQVARQKKVAKASGITFNCNFKQELSFMAPIEVIEVLVNNLLLNALRHCSTPSNIDIQVNAESFKITNQYRKPQQADESFGVGLTLVKALCDRFGLMLKIRNDDGLFVVTITKGLFGKIIC